MKNYNDFIEGLQQDIRIPDNVWVEYEKTLSNIGNLSKQQKSGHFRKWSEKKTIQRWIVAAASISAVFFGAFFCSNPIIASKLPIIGRIFEQVEDEVTYSGDYANIETLQESENNTSPNNKYTAENNGIRITVSEVFCDGYSIYLTAQIESESGGFSLIPAHYTRRFGDITSHSINTNGTWCINDDTTETFPFGNTFEGKIIDDNTFAGMMKLDQEQYIENDSILHLNLTEFLYDAKNNPAADTLDPTSRIDGNWELTIPFTVDNAQCRTIDVNKKNEDGYGIRKVFISPYQIIVFADVPFTTLSPDTYTREDFEKQWGEKNKEIAAGGDLAITYEEVLSQKHYDYYELELYNQDGEPIEQEYGNYEKTVFAVQKHDLSKLHIYMGNESHELSGNGTSNEQDAKEHCILEAEINLEQ